MVGGERALADQLFPFRLPSLARFVISGRAKDGRVVEGRVEGSSARAKGHGPRSSPSRTARSSTLPPSRTPEGRERDGERRSVRVCDRALVANYGQVGQSGWRAAYDPLFTPSPPLSRFQTPPR